MKKLSTEIKMMNGKTKEICVELEDEIADWIINEPPEVYAEYIKFEYNLRNTARKEDRRKISYDEAIMNEIDMTEAIEDVADIYESKIDLELLRQGISSLLPQQKWLLNELFINNKSQVELAKELGVGESAIRSRLKKIINKLKKT